MAKNLRGQFNWAINSNFQEGIDKHADKRNNGWKTSEHVYSYTSRKNLLDFSKTLNNWIKQNAPEINRIEKLTPEVTQKFLQEKAESCTQKTINAYSSYLRKLEILTNNTYNQDLTYGSSIVTPPALTKKEVNRGVKAQMRREDLDKVIEECKQRDCQSAYAIRLEEKLGVRVQEIATISKENIDLENNKIIIENSKGGREFTREIDVETKELVTEIIDKNYSESKLFTVQDDSINKYLGEIEKELGLEAHSVHDIRRTLAQEKYDSYRAEGYTIEEAADLTSLYLNHNKDRMAMLRESYIILR